MRNLPPSTFTVGGKQPHDWLNEHAKGQHIDVKEYENMWQTVSVFSEKGANISVK